MKRFCGFEQIKKWMSNAPDSTTRGLIIVLFKTGGRISEVLGTERTEPYKPRFFEFGDKWFYGYNLPVLKKYTKTGIDRSKTAEKCEHCGKKKKEALEGEECPAKQGEEHVWKTYFPHWSTKPENATRTINWLASEPLNEEFRNYIESFEPDEPLFDIARSTAWVKLNRASENLWPHRLRAERATQLGEHYHFDKAYLKEFFAWETEVMPDQYSGPRQGMNDLMTSRGEKLWGEQKETKGGE